MIDVNAAVATRRIETLVKELKYVSSDTFLQGLALVRREKEALSFLKSIFPHSLGKSTSNVNEFGTHLWNGWMSDHYVSGSKIGFTIYHDLEGNERAETVLRSLDTGSKAFSYTVKETIHFLGDANAPALKKRGSSVKESLLWVTFAEGTEIHRGEREGSHYTDKTEAYIRSVIMPELEADITAKVESRMNRI